MKRFILPIGMLTMACGAVAEDDLIKTGLDCSFESMEEYRQKGYYKLVAGGGISRIGSDASHEKMYENLQNIEFEPDRTALIMTELEHGNLSVYYCEQKQCTREEELGHAFLHCVNALAADRCFIYAVRVQEEVFCRLAPSFNQ